MEIERRHAPVKAEVLEYLSANPTPPPPPVGSGGETHFHVHHHYAPAEPVAPPGSFMHQGPAKTFPEKVIPWLWLGLFACVILTLCAAILAVFALILVAVLGGLIVFGLVAAYVIRSQGVSLAAVADAKAGLADSERRRDEARDRKRSRR